jgi:prepilin-type N-terminal cleavage/methylation domain-containing protein
MMHLQIGARSAGRRGMTLIEMLVATAATLMLMGAVAQVFSVFGSAVTNSRSMIELDARTRTVAWRLRSDLAGATARPVPPLSPAAAEGYFEVIEGPLNDNTATDGSTTLAADTDDALLFTTRSAATAFLGKAGAETIESPTAEVVWFLRPNGGTNPTTYTLFRRQLLVVGYAGFPPFSASANTTGLEPWNTFYNSYDLSVRREGNLLIPNTLADLTRRESRFLHNPSGITDGSGFPYAFNPGTAGLVFDSSRVGEDVVLTNVLAFDVRVFDPTAPIGILGDDPVVPGDPGFTGSAANGAYVDLGNGQTAAGPSGIAPHFSGTGQRNYRGQSGGLAGSRTWDTWSTHYESNGLDDDGDGAPDQGADGVDSNGNGQTDEAAEHETSPPYPYPLRGIEVRIRCWEPSSRQVRQVTVRHTFVPH